MLPPPLSMENIPAMNSQNGRAANDFESSSFVWIFQGWEARRPQFSKKFSKGKNPKEKKVETPHAPIPWIFIASHRFLHRPSSYDEMWKNLCKGSHWVIVLGEIFTIQLTRLTKKHSVFTSFEYLNICFYQFWILGDPQLSLWLVILPQLIHDTSIILSSDHLVLSSYHPVFLSSCHHRLNPPISGCTARETNPISFSPRNWIQLIDFPANWCAPSPHQRASGKLISRSGLRLLEVVHGEILISRNQLKYWSVETSWSFGQ